MIFGMNNVRLIALLTVIIVMVSAVAFTVSGGFLSEGKSLTSPTAGCNIKELNVRMSGEIIVKDGALFGIEPEISRIGNVGIRANPLASFEPFNLEVVAYDDTTGEKLDTHKSSEELSSSVKESTHDFTIIYQLPDQNCDGIVDDQQVRLEVTISETKDVFKDTSKETFLCDVSNGGVSC